MRSIYLLLIAALYTLFVTACNTPVTTDDHSNAAVDTLQSTSSSFAIGISAAAIQNELPALQSFVWANNGTKILLLGGRTEGFHGLTGADSAFKSSKDNASVYVMDISSYTYKE